MKKFLIAALAMAVALSSCSDPVSRLVRDAEKGDPDAQLEYGRLLKTVGNGVDQNWPMAVEMLQRSSDYGNADAQWELGLLYEHGNHVDKDEAKAFSLYSSSADAGNPMGIYLVAHCYQHGLSVEEDHAVSDSLYAKAVALLDALAPQEDMYVLNFIGSAYQWGDGVQVDRKKAFDYYIISAEKGNPETQYKVGSMYLQGQGVERNREEARVWLEKSAAQGFADAVSLLERLNR